MNINGHKVDIEQIAHAVALAYTTAHVDDSKPPEMDEIVNLVQDYLNVYKMVTELDEDSIKSLL